MLPIAIPTRAFFILSFLIPHQHSFVIICILTHENLLETLVLFHLNLPIFHGNTFSYSILTLTVPVASYNGKKVEKKASEIIGKGRKKEEQCVVFTIKRRVEDKNKDGKNGEDFSREVTYLLEMLGQVSRLRREIGDEDWVNGLTAIKFVMRA